MKKIVASIEARMTSTRLPGKILKPCMNRPMLELLVERLKRASLLDSIVVSTTTNASDDITVETAERIGVGYYRGSEEEVLTRVMEAMQVAKADVVVQITGDCPLLDPDIVDQIIRLFVYNQYDYVCNHLVRSYPRGLDCAVISMKALEKSVALIKDAAQLEHVGLSIYENQDKFKLLNVFAPSELCRPDYRWTLDTEDDYKFITTIFEKLYPKNPKFNSFDILELIRNCPEIPKINQHIIQKSVR